MWPVWLQIWLGITALLFLLRVMGAIRSVPLCFFLSAVAGAFAYSLAELGAVRPVHLLGRLRQVILVTAVVLIPPLFGPQTAEAIDLPRLVLLVVAAAAVVATWVVDAVWSGWRPRRLVNGFQWILLATLVWFAITTLTSVEPRQSILGRYGSNEGLLLIAALVVLAFALAESFSASDLPALFRIVVAASVPVVVYGFIQMYGFVIDKHSSWDFFHWQSSLHNVFSSFGNPNHLAGYLVTVLPFGLVAAVLARRSWIRILLWCWVGLVLVIVLQTAARGAWLGMLAAAGILGVGLFPLWRRRSLVVGLVSVGALGAVVALLAGGSRFIGGKAAALFQFGSGSSVSQRYGYWSAALRLAGHHLVTGTGPDTYSVMYARYQDPTLAHELGNTFYVNGPHNIFLSWLANEGVPGLFLIVGLLGLAVGWGVRTFRRHGRTASEIPPLAVESGSHRRDRYLVLALTASALAYFVQASFDVEQVGTMFMIFAVVGLLGSANRGAWSMSELRRLPVRLVAATTTPDQPAAEVDPAYPRVHVPAPRYRQARYRDQEDVTRVFATLAVGAVALTGFALTTWRASSLVLADHDAWRGSQSALLQATALNPWQPVYLDTLARQLVSFSASTSSPADAKSVLQDAAMYSASAVALDPYSAGTQIEYGNVLQAMARLNPADKASARAALAAYRRALADDPFDTNVPRFIRTTEPLLATGYPGCDGAGCKHASGQSGRSD